LKAGQRLRQRSCISRRHQNSGATGEHVRQPSDRARDQAAAQAERFQRGQRQAFRQRRHGDDIRRREDRACVVEIAKKACVEALSRFDQLFAQRTVAGDQQCAARNALQSLEEHAVAFLD